MHALLCQMCVSGFCREVDFIFQKNIGLFRVRLQTEEEQKLRVCVHVCMCVLETEREKEKEKDSPLTCCLCKGRQNGTGHITVLTLPSAGSHHFRL